MGIPEKIKAIEEEMARTQVNKATNRHLGVLKARIARLKEQQEERIRKSRGKVGVGYTLKKDGDATVVLLGLPSVGKSTLMNHVTNSNSKVGAYDFTTVTVEPGILNYKGARIQVLDIPGIIRDASKGRGLGRRILSATRSADLILVMMDVFNPGMREMLLDEIRAIGLRPDETRPDIKIEKRGSGGVVVTDLIGMTEMTSAGVKDVLREYRYHNSRVVIREDITYDQLLDVLMKNRVYVPTLTIINKMEMVDQSYLDELRENADYDFIAISADNDLNLEALKEEIFRKLNFIRIYLKPKGEEADYEEPLIIRNGATVEDIADKVHRKLKKDLRYTRIWGPSVKFGGQKVGLNHNAMDEDVITFFT
ncbi:MAG: GTP-binding protein [Candidatus Bathyarchaeota archaeon]|nr:GTP-binding protein [Candidatus Bathyarchaeota archaeon]